MVSTRERTLDETQRLADWALWGAVALLLVNPLFVVNGGLLVEPEAVRVSGAGTHMNPFSFYLLAIILLCVARVGVREQTRYLLLAGTAAIWMALTLTRITVLASLVAVIVVSLYAAFVNGNRRTLIAIVLVGVLIAVLTLEGVLVRTFGYVPTPRQLFALAADPVGLFQAINWQGRETLWGVLGIAFLASPIVGSGLGASSYALTVGFGPEVAHNEYLRLAVDVGLVGCLLYFLAVSAWIAAVVRAVRTARPEVEEFTMPALALIAAWAVIAITDNAFDYYTPFTQYVGFLVGASMVAARQADATSDEAETSPKPGRIDAAPLGSIPPPPLGSPAGT